MTIPILTHQTRSRQMKRHAKADPKTVPSLSADPQRRALTSFLLASCAAFALPMEKAFAQTASHTFRIGYQKAASTLVLLRANGNLEKALAPAGVTVKWVEFPAGPQLLEGLNVGAIDFGYVGEAPPVFAQAAGADFVYTAYEVPTPQAEGILVAKDAAITNVAQLKGRKIAFNKGSDVHWFIVALLQKHGLTYRDIQPVYLAPADARAALTSGSVDAWAIWDPFLAAAEQQSGARLLVDGRGVVSHHQFFLTARPYAKAHDDIVKLTLNQLSAAGQQILADTRAAALALSPLQGLPPEIIEAGLKHYAHVYKPIDAPVLVEQQRIADAFYALKLIPRPIRVRDATLVNF